MKKRIRKSLLLLRSRIMEKSELQLHLVQQSLYPRFCLGKRRRIDQAIRIEQKGPGKMPVKMKGLDTAQGPIKFLEHTDQIFVMTNKQNDTLNMTGGAVVALAMNTLSTNATMVTNIRGSIMNIKGRLVIIVIGNIHDQIKGA